MKAIRNKFRPISNERLDHIDLISFDLFMSFREALSQLDDDLEREYLISLITEDAEMLRNNFKNKEDT